MNRIEKLVQFIAEDPNDPFPRYALALEYLHQQPELARKCFEELMETFPEYLPAYYPAAHLYIEWGEPEKAERTFQSGLELARKQGDRKTEQELRQAHEQWLFNRS